VKGSAGIARVFTSTVVAMVSGAGGRGAGEAIGEEDPPVSVLFCSLSLCSLLATGREGREILVVFSSRKHFPMIAEANIDSCDKEASIFHLSLPTGCKKAITDDSMTTLRSDY
jgi:hypothetical protein